MDYLEDGFMVKIRLSTARKTKVLSDEFWIATLLALLTTATLTARTGFASGIWSLNFPVLGVVLLTFLVVRLAFAYTDMKKRREMSERFYYHADDARSQAELRYKVAKAAASNARERANEAQADLEASRAVADDLLQQVNDLHEEVKAAATKDALIEALRRRVSNINAEYNDKHSGQRKTTTLQDVYRLTGEADVR